MKRLHAFNNAALVLAAAIASAFAPIVTDAIKPRLGTGPAVLLVFTGVLIGLFLLQWLVGTIVSKSQFLRRLLLGHSFVEGYWVDVSRDPRNRVTGAACVYIFYEDDQLKIDGTTLKAKDGMYGTWGVRFAMFQDHTLAYAFESHTNRSESPYETGYAQLKFSHSGKAPTSYSGFFFRYHQQEIDHLGRDSGCGCSYLPTTRSTSRTQTFPRRPAG